MKLTCGQCPFWNDVGDCTMFFVGDLREDDLCCSYSPDCSNEEVRQAIGVIYRNLSAHKRARNILEHLQAEALLEDRCRECGLLTAMEVATLNIEFDYHGHIGVEDLEDVLFPGGQPATGKYFVVNGDPHGTPSSYAILDLEDAKQFVVDHHNYKEQGIFPTKTMVWNAKDATMVEWTIDEVDAPTVDDVSFHEP